MAKCRLDDDQPLKSLRVRLDSHGIKGGARRQCSDLSTPHEANRAAADDKSWVNV